MCSWNCISSITREREWNVAWAAAGVWELGHELTLGLWSKAGKTYKHNFHNKNDVPSTKGNAPVLLQSVIGVYGYAIG